MDLIRGPRDSSTALFRTAARRALTAVLPLGPTAAQLQPPASEGTFYPSDV